VKQCAVVRTSRGPRRSSGRVGRLWKRAEHEFAGGGNGGKRRRSVLRARREGDGVYRWPRLVKVVVRASSRRMVTTWARCRLSGLVTCGGASPMVRGGATVRRVWARRVAPA
jgi:hypothetical protein